MLVSVDTKPEAIGKAKLPDQSMYFLKMSKAT